MPVGVGAQRECSGTGGWAGSVRDGRMNEGMRGSFKIMRRKRKDEGWMHQGAWLVAVESERGRTTTPRHSEVCVSVCERWGEGEGFPLHCCVTGNLIASCEEGGGSAAEGAGPDCGLVYVVVQVLPRPPYGSAPSLLDPTLSPPTCASRSHGFLSRSLSGSSLYPQLM